MNFRRSEFDVTNRINTTDPVCVKLEVARIFRALYSRREAVPLERAFDEREVLVRLGRREVDRVRARVFFLFRRVGRSRLKSRRDSLFRRGFVPVFLLRSRGPSSIRCFELQGSS